MRRSHVTSEFALRSLAMTIACVLLLFAVTALAVREVVVQSAAHSVRAPVEAALRARLAGTASTAALSTPDTSLRAQLLSPDVVAVRVLDRQGSVIYSTDRTEMGAGILPRAALGRALDGGVTTRVVRDGSDAPSGLLVRRFGPVVECDVPLRTQAGETVGVYQVFHRYGPLGTLANRAIALIWAAIALVGGLAHVGHVASLRVAEGRMRFSEEQLVEARERLRDSLAEIESHSVGTLQALVTAVDAKDAYTSSHSLGVADCARAIGRRLGLAEEDLLLLEKASLLHDIGKIGVPERCLLKPDALTAEEHAIVSEHADLGARIVESVPFLGDVVPIIRHHHERWDGKGYPSRLKGEAIPILARILAVADAYDAMTSDRPYRSGLRWFRVRQQLRRNSGTQFDPAVIAALLQALRAGEVETDGRRAEQPESVVPA